MKINYKMAWDFLWNSLSDEVHLSFMRKLGYSGETPSRPISPTLIARLASSIGMPHKDDNKFCHEDQIRSLH